MSVYTFYLKCSLVIFLSVLVRSLYNIYIYFLLCLLFSSFISVKILMLLWYLTPHFKRFFITVSSYVHFYISVVCLKLLWTIGNSSSTQKTLCECAWLFISAWFQNNNGYLKIKVSFFLERIMNISREKTIKRTPFGGERIKWWQEGKEIIFMTYSKPLWTIAFSSFYRKVCVERHFRL